LINTWPLSIFNFFKKSLKTLIGVLIFLLGQTFLGLVGSSLEKRQAGHQSVKCVKQNKTEIEILKRIEYCRAYPSRFQKLSGSSKAFNPEQLRTFNFKILLQGKSHEIWHCSLLNNFFLNLHFPYNR
jgi:hypothetical protein